MSTSAPVTVSQEDEEYSDPEPLEEEINECKEKIKREGLILDLSKYNIVSPHASTKTSGVQGASPPLNDTPLSLEEEDISVVQDKIRDILDYLGK